jgi:hypothetical protein
MGGSVWEAFTCMISPKFLCAHLLPKIDRDVAGQVDYQSISVFFAATRSDFTLTQRGMEALVNRRLEKRLARGSGHVTYSRGYWQMGSWGEVRQFKNCSASFVLLMPFWLPRTGSQQFQFFRSHHNSAPRCP